MVVKQLFRSDVGEGPPSKLLAVVETHDPQGEPVSFSGEVSLMVMTADADKPLRLKRWDFYPADAAAAWQESHLGAGLHLELPLGKTRLSAEPLELWVRIVHDDGHKLLAQLPFERDALPVLEVETGAQQLQPEQNAGSNDSAEAELVEVPGTNNQNTDQSGWRSSTQRTDMDAGSYSSTATQSKGWTAQRTAGSLERSAAQADRSTTNNGPVWTAGRDVPAARSTSADGSEAQWMPFR